MSDGGRVSRDIPRENPLQPPIRAALLASGGGSNVMALARAAAAAESEAARGGEAPAWKPVILVSDREGAPVLDRAREAGVPTRVVLPDPAGSDPEPGDDFGARLVAALDEEGSELILLAGYLRLVPARVVERWSGRMLNIHPSLLPAFGGRGMYGRRIHDAVLASGARVTGVTVHLVNDRFDDGKIIAQWPVPVLPGDDADALAARVLAVEHRLYPAVTAHVARALARGAPVAPLSPHDLRESGLEYS